MKADLTIDGRGFYQLTAQTRKGQAFMRRVQRSERGTAFCDDSTYALNIADGARDAGLAVEVNGQEYR